jgi:transcriptional antiterminator
MTRGYPLERVYEEVAFIAYHFHWSYEEIMNMDHRERRKWCEEISKINEKLNKKR